MRAGIAIVLLVLGAADASLVAGEPAGALWTFPACGAASGLPGVTPFLWWTLMLVAILAVSRAAGAPSGHVLRVGGPLLVVCLLSHAAARQLERLTAPCAPRASACTGAQPALETRRGADPGGGAS